MYLYFAVHYGMSGEYSTNFFGDICLVSF